MHLSRLPTSLKWRSETQRRLLASQVASLLLQRSDPISLLESNPNLLPSPLPSPLFLRILTRIRSHPQTSLLFFNFARSHLNFQPDIHSVSKLILLLLESNAQSEPHQILEPFLRSHPVHSLLDSLVRAASYCLVLEEESQEDPVLLTDFSGTGTSIDTADFSSHWTVFIGWKIQRRLCSENIKTKQCLRNWFYLGELQICANHIMQHH